MVNKALSNITRVLSKTVQITYNHIGTFVLSKKVQLFLPLSRKCFVLSMLYALTPIICLLSLFKINGKTVITVKNDNGGTN